MVVRASVAVAVLAISLDGGMYGLVERHTLAVVVWWTLFFALSIGVLPRRRVDRRLASLLTLVAGLAALTVLSAAWAPSADAAVREFDLILLYAGVIALVALACTEADVPRVTDGIALGICGVAAVALTSRFFPGAFGADEIPTYLPSASNRLAYPVGYWNGLAVLLALAVPLLLRAVISGERFAGRAAAFAAFPAIGAAVFLTSSRTGFAATAVGAAAFVAITDRRWAALGAVTAAACVAATGVAAMLAWPEVADGPFVRNVWEPAATLAALCVTAGLVHPVAVRFARRLPEPRPAAGWIALAAAGAATVAVLALADVGGRVGHFTDPPPQGTTATAVTTHLLDGGSSGRWQLWTAAVQEFRANPVTGGGAGSYESWWLAHGSIAAPIATAHSLYLESLAELGIAGVVLVGLALAWPIVIAGRSRGTAPAAIAAALVAYAFGAGVDWVWDLPAVTVVAAALAGLATSVRAGAAAPAGAGALRFAAAAACLLVLCAQTVQLLAQLQLESSQSVARSGRYDAAVDAARLARDLQPWAAAPHLQLALVSEEAGRLGAAQRSLGRALRRDRSDWKLWLVAARLETKQGALVEARRSLCRAAELNPRSPLLSATDGPGAMRCARSKVQT